MPVSVSDGDTSSAVWDLSVVVIGGNDAPVVMHAVSDISVDEDADGISISLTGSDTEPYFFDSDGDNDRDGDGGNALRWQCLAVACLAMAWRMRCGGMSCEGLCDAMPCDDYLKAKASCRRPRKWNRLSSVAVFQIDVLLFR